MVGMFVELALGVQQVRQIKTQI